MYNIEYVCGLGYGDEGKGRIAAYVATKYDTDDTISVLCSGSSQRGHTMVDENGVRHVFHHFGCATMYGYHNYIDKRFYSNPMMFRMEWEELESKGITPVVYLNKNSHLVLPYHILADQCYVEIRRDADDVVDSSCGCGVWQAAYYNMFNNRSDEIDINTLINRDKFDSCMRYFRDLERFVSAMVEDADGNIDSEIIDKYWQLINNDNVWENYWEDLNFMVEHCTLVDSLDDIKDAGYKNYVIELSQGLLLDRTYGHDNHVTSCATAPSAYKEFVNHFGRNICNVYLNFVTRWYLTRHGHNVDSYSETMNHSFEALGINGDNVNETNVHNEWQGDFNYGFLSLGRIRHLLVSEYSNFNRNVKVRAFVTCFDQVTNKIYLHKETNPFEDDFEECSCCMPHEFLQQFVKAVRGAIGRGGTVPSCYVCCGEQPENIIKLRKEMISDLRMYNSESHVNRDTYTLNTVLNGYTANGCDGYVVSGYADREFYATTSRYNSTITCNNDEFSYATLDRSEAVGGTANVTIDSTLSSLSTNVSEAARALSDAVRTNYGYSIRF